MLTIRPNLTKDVYQVSQYWKVLCSSHLAHSDDQLKYIWFFIFSPETKCDSRYNNIAAKSAQGIMLHSQTLSSSFFCCGVAYSTNLKPSARKSSLFLFFFPSFSLSSGLLGSTETRVSVQTIASNKSGKPRILTLLAT